MTVVSVHQPNFLPWLKLLAKILDSDVWIAYDTVQFTRSEFHARQRVLTYTGPAWLTVPVRRVPGVREPIAAVRIETRQPWAYRHLRTLRAGYARTPCFDEVRDLVETVYSRQHDLLADLNVALVRAITGYLGSPVRIVRASTVDHHGDNTERLVDLVRGVGGDVHLTSTYGTERGYIDWDRVAAAGIEVRPQRFEHPRYEQAWPGFTPGLACLDLLFARGRDSAGVLAEAGSRCGG
jgi:WbqC-like protein family